MEGSLAVVGQASAAGVTEFANEACDAVSLMGNFVSSSLTIPQADLQDLKAYFERPRLVWRGTYAFGSRSRLVSLDFNRTNMPQFFPQWANRLSGVYGIRFSLNFRLQAAATAFHQGILALNWQYSANVSASTDLLFVRSSDTAASTNLPHVRLDLSDKTMVELKVPFLNEFEFMPVSSGSTNSQYGVIAVSPILSSVSVSGLSPATYELYCFLTDIELFGADNNAVTTITLQSGGGVMLKEMKDSRLLSKSLDNVAKIGSFVNRNIPMLSGVAGPVAWAADIAAGVAKYFGYSKPLIQDPVLRVFRSVYANESNVDVPMAGFAVGLMQSNTLAHSPEIGGTNIDEMALSYVTSQWSQICVGNVLTSDTHGKVIYASPVSPSVLWFRSPSTAPYCNIIFPFSSTSLVSNSGNSFLPSSVMFAASFFRLWRGTLKYRFTFAKTKLHGGRYMVSYNPGYQTQATAANFGGTVTGPEVVSTFVQPYGYSQIMDLRDGNVFEFDVPYVAEVPYSAYTTSTGSISIVCIDPLQGSSTVTPTVPFLVEVCAGEDFELADYAGPYYIPQYNGVIYQQSGGVITATKKPSHLTVGEEIKSVKQIIQSPYFQSFNMGAGSFLKTTIAPWFAYFPSYVFSTAGSLLPNSSSLNIADGAGAAAAIMSKAYAFSRGGTDVHFYTALGGSGVKAYVEQVPFEAFANTGTTAANYSTRSFFSATPKVLTHGEHPLHVRLPAFQFKARVPSQAFDGYGFTTALNNALPQTIVTQRGHVDRLVVYNDNTFTANFWLGRSASDDATLSHYIGPPPMYIPNVLNTNKLEIAWP